MKSILLFLAAVAVAQADFTWEWSKLISLEPQLGLAGQLQRFNHGSRIVGGEEVVPHSHPFQAGVFVHLKEGIGFCGGSIISNYYILTAAHCLDKAIEVEIVVGAHNIREVEPTQQRFFTKDLIVHEKWIALLIKNDIALAKLATPIEFNEFVQPIRLPSHSNAGDTATGNLGNISGWGKPTDEATSISPVLRHVRSKVISNTLCNIAFFGLITEAQMCTSGSGGKSSCNGDSGGPLVVPETDGIDTLRGIVSFGISFGCEIGWPAAFTRVGSFINWIETNSDVQIRS